MATSSSAPTGVRRSIPIRSSPRAAVPSCASTRTTGRAITTAAGSASGRTACSTSAVGDEGLAGDPSNNAQSTDQLWGKLLRIDVDGDDFAGNAGRNYAIPDDNPFVGKAGADEIWALGLRNPWRSSFDRRTGDLYIGDVGQGEREEIDFQKAGSAGGRNYGWKVREGDVVFDDGVPGNPAADDPALVDPVVAYRHDASGGFAVVGGYVYRGESGGMQGRYLYADFVSEQLWSLRMVGNRAVDVTNHTAQVVEKGGSLSGITSFAEDGRGNLYVIGIGGTVSRLSFGDAAGDTGDRIHGGDGHDRLYGGAGNDTIAGGPGRDTIEGGAQDDHLSGGRGADRIEGAGGRDFISGGAGADMLSGGGGADTFFFGPKSASDTITDFADDTDAIRFGGGFGFEFRGRGAGGGRGGGRRRRVPLRGWAGADGLRDRPLRAAG